SLYKQVKAQPHLQASIHLMRQTLFSVQAWKFWTVILLAFINWGLEAKKWQTLMEKLQPLSYFIAFKAVLSGVTLSLNTPNRIGEYGGRILYVKEGNRIKAISLSIAGSMSQLIITLFMGCGGLIFIISTNVSASASIIGLSFFWIKILLFISSCTVIILLLFFFRLSWLIKIIEKDPAFSRYTQYINVLEDFDVKVLLRLLTFSFLRYIVFVLQYILLLQVLNVQMLWIQGFWIITILFLVLAIVPSFAIADLGIRSKFSTELLSFYSTNTIGIIATTFGIWIINLFIPAVVGSVLIIGIRIFKEK
ncbi:MAG TPA: lysylphosphatidylglycerol synthase domain-containing protein, partial [Chitinophagaceae bacterium]|nr:lysylphosphatidylglycerol synthase domain-containing protein [Chitinophagaceae bacterium]